MVSFPASPIKVSAPAPPKIVSLPEPALKTLTLSFPTRTSAFIDPIILSISYNSSVPSPTDF